MVDSILYKRDDKTGLTTALKIKDNLDGSYSLVVDATGISISGDVTATSDITKWGATDLTSRDISLDLKALTDDSVKGILKSIGDVGTGTNLLGLVGEVQATPTANTLLRRLKDILSLTVLASGTNIIGKVGIDQTTPGTTNGIQINAELPAGSNIIGKIGIDQTTPGTTNGIQINAALPAGSNSIGSVKVDQSVPGTTNGVQINAELPAGTQSIGAVQIDQTTPGTTNGVQVNAALPSGSNVIGNIRIDQTTPGTTNGVQVNAAIPTGANVIGAVKIDQTTPGTTNAVQIVNVTPTDNGIISVPYYYQISRGVLPGHYFWMKIGYNGSLIANTEADLWPAGGTYIFPTTAQQMEIASSDNTQDIGAIIFSGTSTGGSTTTLIDTGKNFNGGTPVQVGDCIILDKSGAVPEYGYVSAVTSNTQLTISGGFSSLGTGSGRVYDIIDKSAYTGAHAVQIGYLDENYDYKYEIAILNGTTVVPTVVQIYLELIHLV